jgi:UDP-N-acetylmuramyl pentapeptide synthase
MRHRLRDLPALVGTPLGRKQLAEGINYRSWPLTSRLAWLHRRTIARSTRVVAVVGSLGKSTTRRAICAALGLPPEEAGYNAWSAIARAVMSISHGQPRAVIEVGIADKGQMRPYASVVRPDVTVVTSIASEHHRSLGTLDVTRDEKAWMVRAIRPGGVAVLNGDDANVLWMAGETRARVVTYGFGADCDVRAEDASLDWPRGMRFRLTAFGRSHDVAIRLLGRHMIYPALAAFAVSQLEGTAPGEALARIAALPPRAARMEPVPLPNGAILLRDEIKSTTETIDAALDLLAEVPARRIVLLGDISEPIGSQYPAYKRIGERVARSASLFFVLGGGYGKYRPGARRAGMAAERIVDAGRSPRRAAELLAAAIEPGDVVLVKGRDTQKLDRVRLILSGRDVRCDIAFCNVRTVQCGSCPMLERGWKPGEAPP